MPELWILLLAFGAAARLTRFITADTLTGPFRAKIMTWFGPESMAYEFIRCPWCVGMWLSLGSAVVAYTPFAHTTIYAVLCLGLTFSQLIGWAANKLEH